MSNQKYQASIARGLETALARAARESWDADADRVIVFSDLHRGQGDHADDFRVCAETYRRAITFYFDAGYRLVTLGDADELWEGWPGKVVPTYRNLLDLENRFHTARASGSSRSGATTTISGSTRTRWRATWSRSSASSPVPEGLDVTVTQAGETLGRVFLVHGHQGTGAQRPLGRKYSRHFVRWVWRPVQRLFKISLNTPATDFEIRGKHDRAMYEWAAGAQRSRAHRRPHPQPGLRVETAHVETLERVQDSISADPDGGDQRTAQHSISEIDWAKAEASTDRDDDQGGRAHLLLQPRLLFFQTATSPASKSPTARFGSCAGRPKTRVPMNGCSRPGIWRRLRRAESLRRPVMDISDAARDLHAAALVIDAHVHPSLKTYLFKKKLWKRPIAAAAPSTHSPCGSICRRPSPAASMPSCPRSICPRAVCSTTARPLKLAARSAPKRMRRLFKGDPLRADPRNPRQLRSTPSTRPTGRARELARVVRSTDELLRASADGVIAVVHAVEGGHSLGGRAEQRRERSGNAACAC